MFSSTEVFFKHKLQMCMKNCCASLRIRSLFIIYRSLHHQHGPSLVIESNDQMFVQRVHIKVWQTKLESRFNANISFGHARTKSNLQTVFQTRTKNWRWVCGRGHRIRIWWWCWLIKSWYWKKSFLTRTKPWNEQGYVCWETESQDKSWNEPTGLFLAATSFTKIKIPPQWLQRLP